MKFRLPVFACAILVLCSCNSPQEVGVRYRAERDLWRATREARRLSIQPKLVSREEWQSLATRFENVAEEYGTKPAPSDDSEAGQAANEVRQVAARALINAAEVHAIAGDSTRMMQDYEKVASEFQDQPLMAGEVALVRGRIAASKGQLEKAIEAYQTVLRTVPPQPAGVGVGAAVLDLPLLVARLETKLSGTAPAAANGPYGEARSRYQAWIDANPGTLIEMDSRRRLADVAADCGDLDTAITSLRQLETELRTKEFKGRDPAAVRFGIATLERRTDPSGEATRKTLASLLEDYPKSPRAPQALLVLAKDAAEHGKVDVALADLDRIRDDYSGATDIVAQSLLVRGKVLDRSGRWPEALETYRSLPLEQPTSDAALQAPLEIVAHYTAAKDSVAVEKSLAEAEKYYRDFIARYPPGPASLTAHVKLVQTLALQKRYEEAVNDLVELGESMNDKPQGASFFVDAARMAYRDMHDRDRAVKILERAGELYPGTEVGRWAVNQATRLREELTP